VWNKIRVHKCRTALQCIFLKSIVLGLLFHKNKFLCRVPVEQRRNERENKYVNDFSQFVLVVTDFYDWFLAHVTLRHSCPRVNVEPGHFAFAHSRHSGEWRLQGAFTNIVSLELLRFSSMWKQLRSKYSWVSPRQVLKSLRSLVSRKNVIWRTFLPIFTYFRELC
jgi:hypothetical protein